MEAHLADFIRNTAAGHEAEEILRRCVHCGFCNATCPTYQLLGDELDGPRGRIYLIKQVLEGVVPTRKTQLHLDRCLSCRACETTCPSGVQFNRLLDIGRDVVDGMVPRRRAETFVRGTLKALVPRSTLFGVAMKLGQSVRLMLPSVLRAKVPPQSDTGPVPQRSHARKLIALAGCVQPSMYPNINGATRRVLDRLDIEMIEPAGAGCCGAVRLHLGDTEAARDDARRNIDAWWPLLETTAEGLVMTASGCGSHVLEYAWLLQDDPDYAVKAARVVLATRDISEVIAAEAAGLKALLQGCAPLPEEERLLAFHSPCSLQHGLRIRGTVESLLTASGYALTAVADAHLCCGSAGTFSVLQPALASRMLDNKIEALTAGAPAAIASANVGCIAHLQGATTLPVSHWIEVFDERLSS